MNPPLPWITVVEVVIVKQLGRHIGMVQFSSKAHVDPEPLPTGNLNQNLSNNSSEYKN
jgi:hypothetical protein